MEKNMFEYIVTIFKVVAGVITNERLTIAALVALGVLLLWIVFSLCFSFEMKFLSGARKINKHISRNGISGESKKELSRLVQKMPSEFVRGYRAYEKNPHSLPSSFIKRSDCLDLELNGGVFNQNRSIIKSYINTVFFAILIFSFAIMSSSSLFEGGATGTDSPLTGYMVAEALLLPLMFLLLSKSFYYVYTAIRQHQYHVAVEEFNEMIDNFDKSAMDTYGYIPNALAQNVDTFKEKLDLNQNVETTQEPVVFENQKESFQQNQSVEENENVNDEILEEQNNEEVVQSAFEDEKQEEPIVFVRQTENTNEDVLEKPEVLVEEEPIEQAIEEIPEEVNEVEVVDEISNENEEMFADENLEKQETEVPVFEEQDVTKSEEQFQIQEDFETFEENTENESQEKQNFEEKEETEMNENQTIEDNFKPDFASLLGENEQSQKRGRGRPKKEVKEGEEFVIKTDKEFEEALVRAEKLMRKNEEPLSASQTKRIEKQLKELIDAMSKYKENK